MAKILKINKDNGGWGGPLNIPVEEGKKILSMTGGGIHPLAEKISELTGLEAVDGFKDGIKDEEIFVAIINCGGTLRCGVYPQKNVYTININPIGASGPLAKHITEDIYVSGVSSDSLELLGEGQAVYRPEKKMEFEEKKDVKVKETSGNWFLDTITKIGTSLGGVISLAYDAGRESVDTVIKSVLPFMVFVSVLVTIILSSGIGNLIANTLKPLASSLPGLLLISLICGIPFLSPLLGPGAAIAQVVGVLLGSQIAIGAIPPRYALPALFAINVQVGADFVPVGLSMQEAEPDTIKYGTPAFLISRQITGPIAVLVAYLMSIGLY